MLTHCVKLAYISFPILGTPPQDSVVSLNISVIGAAVTPVKFKQDRYSKTLMENAISGTEVFRPQASGPEGTTGITFSLVSTNSAGLFRIEESTGKVYIAKSLDYEKAKKHVLVIRAEYKASGAAVLPMATEVEGTVTLEDVNDNSPRFLFDTEPKTIALESYTPAGATVLRVSSKLCLIHNH